MSGDRHAGWWNKIISDAGDYLYWGGPIAASGKIISNTIRLIQEGVDPDSAVAEVVGKEITKTTGVVVPEDGTLMQDAAGNRAIVYPDGRIEELK